MLLEEVIRPTILFLSKFNDHIIRFVQSQLLNVTYTLIHSRGNRKWRFRKLFALHDFQCTFNFKIKNGKSYRIAIE